MLARRLNCFADFARRKVFASVLRSPDLVDGIGCCSHWRRNWEYIFSHMSHSQKPVLNVYSFNATQMVGITLDGWYSTAHNGPCCPLILLRDPMGQRKTQMEGRSTAPTYIATCVSPWELRALTQNISANTSVCTWASVKFAVPLAIFYLALQHDSSGQAIVPTLIFPPAAC